MLSHHGGQWRSMALMAYGIEVHCTAPSRSICKKHMETLESMRRDSKPKSLKKGGMEVLSSFSAPLSPMARSMAIAVEKKQLIASFLARLPRDASFPGPREESHSTWDGLSG